MSDVVNVETMIDDDVAVAQVTVKVGATVARYTGSSKRHPKDSPDGVTGEALAVARALSKAAKDIETLAHNRVDAAHFTKKYFSHIGF